jgi:hypothetical protein
MFPSLEIAAAMAHPDGILTLPSISMSYSPSFRQKTNKKRQRRRRRTVKQRLCAGERLCSPCVIIYRAFFIVNIKKQPETAGKRGKSEKARRKPRLNPRKNFFRDAQKSA